MGEFKKLREFPVDNEKTELLEALNFTQEEVEVMSSKMAGIMSRFIESKGKPLSTAAQEIGEQLTIKELVMNATLHFKTATEKYLIDKMQDFMNKMSGVDSTYNDDDEIEKALD